MEFFLQQLVTGLASGGIYASLALALVVIYKATDVINLAQGEMAMFSTYLAWTLIQAGFPFWISFALTIAVAFAVGMLVERVIIRPVAAHSELSVIVVFVGLFAAFNSVAGWIWTYTVTPFASPFPDEPLNIYGDVLVRAHSIGAVVVTLLVLLAVFLFFKFTPIGLAMRAAAQNSTSSRLVGIKVGLMLGMGWGLAAAIGAVAGMMVAPIVFLDPHMMTGILIYAFAGALLGGVSSPVGAVVGGFLVGVMEIMVGSYVPGGADLRLSFALLVIVAVLVVRPVGLFGTTQVVRV